VTDHRWNINLNPYSKWIVSLAGTVATLFLKDLRS
jgi:hypothetical protein